VKAKEEAPLPENDIRVTIRIEAGSSEAIDKLTTALAATLRHLAGSGGWRMKTRLPSRSAAGRKAQP
jgi:hypothetical protein